MRIAQQVQRGECNKAHVIRIQLEAVHLKGKVTINELLIVKFENGGLFYDI